jgi:glycosyltransferase involved in cell wall biosynthesis
VSATVTRRSISVIAPLHNAGAYLDDFLERISVTVGAEAQLILIDDASTDSTGSRIVEWATGRTNVIARRNQVNLGVAGSRNFALQLADREYVWFVDHDDGWRDDALDVFAAAAQDADIVVCRAEYRHDPARSGRIIDGVHAGRAIDRDQLIRHMLQGEVNGFLWSKLIRRRCLDVDPFPKLSSQSDFVGFTVAVRNADRVVLIPDVLYSYLRRESSITRHENPELSNLEVAHRSMLELVRDHPLLTDNSRLTSFFTAWFYCRAAAFTPIRQGASAVVRSDGIRRAKAAMAGIPLLPVLIDRPTLGVSLFAIRYASPLYSIGIDLLLRLKQQFRGDAA